MGKIKELSITFDHSDKVYQAGEMLRGEVLIDMEQPSKIKAFKLKIKGRALVMWQKQKKSPGPSGQRTVAYTANTEYFDKEFNLLDSDESKELPAGRQTYNFEFPLPENLPSSFEGEHGNIRYSCKVTVDQPKKFNHDVKERFTVVGRVCLEDNSQLKSEWMQRQEEDVSCCCCVSGSVSAEVKINRQAFVRGENMYVTAEVHNNSNSSVTGIKAILTQETLYFAKAADLFSSGSQSREESTKDIPLMSKEDEIAAGQSYTWDNLPAQIPEVPPSQPYGIININYFIKIYVISNWGEDLKFKNSITIGTVPYNDDSGAVTTQPS